MKIEDVTMNEFKKLVKTAERVLASYERDKKYFQECLDQDFELSSEREEAYDEYERAETKFEEFGYALQMLGFKYERKTDDDGMPKYIITNLSFFE